MQIPDSRLQVVDMSANTIVQTNPQGKTKNGSGFNFADPAERKQDPAERTQDPVPIPDR